MQDKYELRKNIFNTPPTFDYGVIDYVAVGNGSYPYQPASETDPDYIAYQKILTGKIAVYNSTSTTVTQILENDAVNPPTPNIAISLSEYADILQYGIGYFTVANGVLVNNYNSSFNVLLRAKAEKKQALYSYIQTANMSKPMSLYFTGAPTATLGANYQVDNINIDDFYEDMQVIATSNAVFKYDLSNPALTSSAKNYILSNIPVAWAQSFVAQIREFYYKKKRWTREMVKLIDACTTVAGTTNTAVNYYSVFPNLSFETVTFNPNLRFTITQPWNAQIVVTAKNVPAPVIMTL